MFHYQSSQPARHLLKVISEEIQQNFERCSEPLMVRSFNTYSVTTLHFYPDVL